MISVIIRTKNEERWIRRCIEGVLAQDLDQDIEIVLVDNASSDKTVARARAADANLKLVSLDEFRPGHAINEGIRASHGRYVVCLSAHCPPVDNHWLKSLLQNLDDPQVAGVYGRQVPTRFTNSVDKRDLLLTFGLDRRVQSKDTFFHNANSMFRREVWEQFPFDEQASNIEDRLWGQDVIRAGYKIVYEPEAAVFHYHGIHQANRPDRAANVVRIIEENVPELHPDRYENPFDPEAQEIAALIPLRGKGSDIDFDEQLIQRTVDSARASELVSRVFVTTEDKTLAEIATRCGAEVPFLRDPELASTQVRVDQVLQDFVERLEESGYYPDIVVPLEVTYPFRTSELIDGVIRRLIETGGDTVIAGVPEYRPCWLADPGSRSSTGRERGEYRPLTDMRIPRADREPVHIGIPALVCATYPANIRAGSRLYGEIDLFEINDPLASIEIRTQKDLLILRDRISGSFSPAAAERGKAGVDWQ